MTHTSSRKEGHAFTLIELLVVISIIAILVGILLPALSAAREVARQMQSNTQLRGIHQAMVIHAQNNKSNSESTAGNFPGCCQDTGYAKTWDNNIQSVLAGAGITMHHAGYTRDSGGHPATRFALLLAHDLVSPDYLVTPLETNETIVPYESGIFGGSGDPAHYSYAMLDIVGHIYSGGTVDGGRIAEWTATNNGDAIVLGDRFLGGKPIASAGWSHHSHVTREGSGEWRGGVAWNDNHVETLNTVVATSTHYPGYSRAAPNAEDNIFTSFPNSADDACIWHPLHADLTDAEGGCSPVQGPW